MKQDKVFKTAKELLEYAKDHLSNDGSTSKIIENSNFLRKHKEALPQSEQEIFMDHIKRETAKNFADILGKDVKEIENLLDNEIEDILSEMISTIEPNLNIPKKGMTVSSDDDMVIISFNFIPTFEELIYGLENYDENYFVAIESVGSRENIIVLEYMGKKDMVIGFDEDTNITKDEVVELTKKLVNEIEKNIDKANKKVREKYFDKYLAYKRKKGSILN